MTIPAIRLNVCIGVAVKAKEPVAGVATQAGIQALLKSAAIGSNVESLPFPYSRLPPLVQNPHMIGTHIWC